MLLEIVAWVFFGLVIGAIARMLYPGRQSVGIMGTMALGIVGSFVGGFLSWAVGFAPEDEGAFRGGGWIMSIIGALIVVWAALYFSGRRGDTAVRT